MFRLTSLVANLFFWGGGNHEVLDSYLYIIVLLKKDDQNAKSIGSTILIKFDSTDSLYLLSIKVWTVYCPLVIHGTYTTVPHFNQANPKWSNCSLSQSCFLTKIYIYIYGH